MRRHKKQLNHLETSLLSKTVTKTMRLSKHKKCFISSKYSFRTWLTCEIPGLGKEQSFFMQTKEKSESSKAFNIATYLTSSLFCMSCPVRTVIRRKTKVKNNVMSKFNAINYILSF